MNKDIFEKINDDLVIYFKDIIKQYNLKINKTTDISTAFIAETYILVFFIDKFDIGISYLITDSNGNFVKYAVENFFAEKCDDSDRKNLIVPKKAGDCVINDIVIMESCLSTKWQNILCGDKNWINDLKNSKWFYERKITEPERKLCEEYL